MPLIGVAGRGPSYLRVTTPDNLDLALESLVRKVLREQPKQEDIYSFAAEYFETLVEIRDRAENTDWTVHEICPNHSENEGIELIKLAKSFPKPDFTMLSSSVIQETPRTVVGSKHLIFSSKIKNNENEETNYQHQKASFQVIAEKQFEETSQSDGNLSNREFDKFDKSIGEGAANISNGKNEEFEEENKRFGERAKKENEERETEELEESLKEEHEERENEELKESLKEEHEERENEELKESLKEEYEERENEELKESLKEEHEERENEELKESLKEEYEERENEELKESLKEEYEERENEELKESLKEEHEERENEELKESLKEEHEERENEELKESLKEEHEERENEEYEGGDEVPVIGKLQDELKEKTSLNSGECKKIGNLENTKKSGSQDDGSNTALYHKEKAEESEYNLPEKFNMVEKKTENNDSSVGELDHDALNVSARESIAEGVPDIKSEMTTDSSGTNYSEIAHSSSDFILSETGAEFFEGERDIIKEFIDREKEFSAMGNCTKRNEIAEIHGEKVKTDLKNVFGAAETESLLHFEKEDEDNKAFVLVNSTEQNKSETLIEQVPPQTENMVIEEEGKTNLVGKEMAEKSGSKIISDVKGLESVSMKGSGENIAESKDQKELTTEVDVIGATNTSNAEVGIDLKMNALDRQRDTSLKMETLTSASLNCILPKNDISTESSTEIKNDLRKKREINEDESEQSLHKEGNEIYNTDEQLTDETKEDCRTDYVNILENTCEESSRDVAKNVRNVENEAVLAGEIPSINENESSEGKVVRNIEIDNRGNTNLKSANESAMYEDSTNKIERNNEQGPSSEEKANEETKKKIENNNAELISENQKKICDEFDRDGEEEDRTENENRIKDNEYLDEVEKEVGKVSEECYTSEDIVPTKESDESFENVVNAEITTVEPEVDNEKTEPENSRASEIGEEANEIVADVLVKASKFKGKMKDLAVTSIEVEDPSDGSDTNRSRSSKDGESFEEENPFISAEVKTMVQVQAPTIDDVDTESKDDEGDVIIPINSEIGTIAEVNEGQWASQVNMIKAAVTIQKNFRKYLQLKDKSKFENNTETMEEGSIHLHKGEIILNESFSTDSCPSSSTTRVNKNETAFTLSRSNTAVENFTRNSIAETTGKLSKLPTGNPIADSEVWTTIERELSESAATTIQHIYKDYRNRQRLRREDAVQITTTGSEDSNTESPKKHKLLGTSEFHDSILPEENLDNLQNLEASTSNT